MSKLASDLDLYASGARGREDGSPAGSGQRRASPGLIYDSRPGRARKRYVHLTGQHQLLWNRFATGSRLSPQIQVIVKDIHKTFCACSASASCSPARASPQIFSGAHSSLNKSMSCVSSKSCPRKPTRSRSRLSSWMLALYVLFPSSDSSRHTIHVTIVWFAGSDNVCFWRLGKDEFVISFPLDVVGK